MTLPLQTFQYYNNSTGLNLRDSPTKVPETDASLSLNVDYSTDGAFLTRNGSTIMNKGHQMDQLTNLMLFDYRKSDGSTQVNIIQNGSKIYHNMLNPSAIVTGLNSSAFPDIEFFVTNDNEYAVWGNGVNANMKFNGTNWTNLSLPQATAPVAADNGVGLLGAGNYSYYVSFAVISAGIIIQEGELSPISNVLLLGANRQIQVTIPACTETLAAGVTAQCNARVLYRVSPTSVGVAYRIAIIADNVTLTYNDNTVADGTIEAVYTNQASPISKIVEENFGCMYFVDAASPTDLYESKNGRPWVCDDTNFYIFDGPITCVKRIYGVTFIGTDRSIWVLNGTMASGTSPKRISSVVGIVNNRCADGLSYLYVLATNYNFYRISPTDYSFEQVRLEDPLSRKIQPLFNDINKGLADKIFMKYYTTPNVGKVVISTPIHGTGNDVLIIYNEVQSDYTNGPVWQKWDNIFASSLSMFTISGVLNLYSGDYNGFIWKLDDSSTNGDGAEDNGTVTSATATTLTDSTKTWTVNEFVGVVVRLISGNGSDQWRTIISNTADTLSVSAWTTTPNATTVYAIGGYDTYHFSNWKSVNGSYDALKQLWFIISNLNASGDYTIEMIIQFDFDQTTSNSIVLNVSLAAANTIWNSFIWGGATWGAYEVFQDRIRQGGRFRAMRVGFRNRKSGQPFQCNGYSLSVQDKKLFYRSIS